MRSPGRITVSKGLPKHRGGSDQFCSVITLTFELDLKWWVELHRAWKRGFGSHVGVRFCGMVGSATQRHMGRATWGQTHREDRAHEDTQTRASCEGGGGGWSDTATNRNIKDHQKPPGARKRQNKASFLEPSGGAWPSWYLDLELLDSRMRENKFLILGHQICGKLLPQPYEMDKVTNQI